MCLKLLSFFEKNDEYFDKAKKGAKNKKAVKDKKDKNKNINNNK
jgi:hypothetical protein